MNKEKCALKLVDEIILTENQIRHGKHMCESRDSTMFYFVIGIPYSYH